MMAEERRRRTPTVPPDRRHTQSPSPACGTHAVGHVPRRRSAAKAQAGPRGVPLPPRDLGEAAKSRGVRHRGDAARDGRHRRAGTPGRTKSARLADCAHYAAPKPLTGTAGVGRKG